MAESAEKIVKNLVSQFRAQEGVFSDRINVEDWVPEKWSREDRARFLFLVTVLDYGMRSIILYKGANELFGSDRRFLDPKYLAKQDCNGLTKVMVEHLHIRFPNEAASRWIENSSRLNSEYSSDVLKIFDSESASVVTDRIRSFKGFGPKTGHLFFRAGVNLFSFDYPNVDEIDMPIDRHKLRLTREWGFIDASDGKAAAAKVWKAACKHAGISWLEFDRAFWVYGSKVRPI